MDESQDEQREPIGGTPEKISKRIGRLVLKQWLLICLLVALLLGVVVGVLCRIREEPYTKREVIYLGFIGSLFIRVLKLVALPLVIISLMSSIIHLNLPMLGRLGLRVVVYYLGTTFVAVLIGLVLAMSIQPGKGTSQTAQKVGARYSTIVDSVLDIFRNVVPSNLVQACLFSHVTTYDVPKLPKVNGTTAPAKSYSNAEIMTWGFHTEVKSKTTNFMGVVCWTIVIAITTILCKEVVVILIPIFDCLNVIIMLCIRVIINLSPVPIFFIVVSKLVADEDLGGVLLGVAWFIMTVVVGLSIHCLIVLPLIYFTITRKNPYKFLFNMLEAIVTAFVTASSVATLSVTLQCLEQKNHLPMVITRFIAPLGATVNMDGTAMYLVMAPLFIYQLLENSTPSFAELILVCVTATLASVGTAGIPQASLILMSMVLSVMGIPGEHIAHILTVDWLLDRFRTAVNIVGDSFGAGVIYHQLKNSPQLAFFEQQQQQRQPSPTSTSAKP